MNAQGEWHSIFPEPTGNDLDDVYFADEMNGWAVGEKGTIIYTSDGGVSWTHQESNTDVRLRSVCFTDNQTGWITGGETHPIPGEYIILHTDNGGDNWIRQDYDSTGCMRNIYFTDTEHGWIVGDDNYTLHTSDGGENWNVQDCGSGYSNQWEVFFIDTLNGWITSDEGLKRTFDGGENWTIKIPGDFESVFFLDEDEGWASTFVYGYMSSSGILIHTNDGFDTWDTLYQHNDAGILTPGFTSTGYYSMFFMDSINGWTLHYSCYSGGWVPGCSYRLLETHDGGTTWNNTGLPFHTGLDALYFTPQGSGYIAGNHGVILKNSGWWDPWIMGSEGNNMGFYSIHFQGLLSGWAAGAQYFSVWSGGTRSAILHTNDGGFNWEEQISPLSGPIRSIRFSDAYKGWAVGNSGDTACIIYTSNAGEEWSIQNSDTGYFLQDVFVLDESNIWAVGGSSNGNENTEGKVLRTSDGGSIWIEQPCDSCLYLNSVHFSDLDRGWAVGNAIYSSRDGGQTWTEQQVDTSGFILESVFFTDDINGWAAGSLGYDGILLHTTDGGKKWTPEFFNMRLHAVSFRDEDHGFTTSSIGTVFETSDGGTTWAEKDTPTIYSLSDIHLNSDGSAFACGSWGSIIKYDPLVTSSDEPAKGIPDHGIRARNYPNPFSGSTTIMVTLSDNIPFNLFIFNTLGQVIDKVACARPEDGEAKITWDGQGWPGGIYYYEIRTHNQTRTGKMILTK